MTEAQLEEVAKSLASTGCGPGKVRELVSALAESCMLAAELLRLTQSGTDDFAKLDALQQRTYAAAHRVPAILRELGVELPQIEGAVAASDSATVN